jgi:DNA-binding winged helix-turn-helix (wHTH) protein
MTSGGDNRGLSLLVLGPFRIDLDRGIVAGPDGPSGLSPRAENLLLLLCRHANMPVSRDEMHRTVWAGRHVEDSAISSAIWQIRKALGDEDKSILQTRAKRGYVLVLSEDAWRGVQQSNLAGTDSATPTEAPKTDASDLGGDTALAAVSAAAKSVSTRKSNRHRMSLRFLVRIVLGLSFFFAATAYWILRSGPEIQISQNDEMSVFIGTPKTLVWLRRAVIRVVVEETYLRGSSIILFEKPQKRNHFSNPHLEVEVRSVYATSIDAVLRLSQSDIRIERTFKGRPQELPMAAQTMLKATLSSTTRTLHPAADAFIDGIVAHALDDLQGAVERYRHAIARAPHMYDAKIRMASALYVLGRSREAFVVLEQLLAEKSLSATHRCSLDELLLSVAPERIGDKPCSRVQQLRSLDEYDARQTLRKIAATKREKKDAGSWFADTSDAIDSYIQLGERPQVEAAIAEASQIADDAGWEYARILLEDKRGLLALYDHQTENAIMWRLRSALDFDAIGAHSDALRHRISALEMQPVLPGNDVVRRREILVATVDAARRLGNVQVEVDALQLLLRVDRDVPEAWHSHLQRIKMLIAVNFTANAQVLPLQKMLSEIVAQRRYGDALAGLVQLKSSQASAQDRLFALLLEARVHFARDEIHAAVAAVDAMERENFKISDSGNSCLFSWLFVEAGRPARARALLSECRANGFDPTSQAQHGDYGLLAETRLLQQAQDLQQVWPLLQPRIAGLLAAPKLTRAEADSLAMLARHAVGMPKANLAELRQALSKVDTVARLHGAGPAVRLGSHLLRWRLCTNDQHLGCGSVLPDWADEDLLEARLMLQAVSDSRLRNDEATH